MNVRFTPEAEADYASARSWYEEQSRGLGSEFRRSVDACLSAVRRHPEAFPTVRPPLKRALLRRFPCALFYLAEPDELVVLGLLHVARDPERWPRPE